MSISRGVVLIYLIQARLQALLETVSTSTHGNCSKEIFAAAYQSHQAQALDETVASHFKPDRPLRFPLQEVRGCWRFSPPRVAGDIM